ncbi:MAG: acyltransferase, partial [Ilumatobacteraceae bacterium]
MPTTTQREGGSLRPSDPPALRRLVELDLTPTSVRRSEQVEEHARRTLAAPVRRRGPARPFGHQPGLDGLRALAVIVVILYHGGFPWIHGGWLGVEVFFVVSGFLITTLLLEERERTGRVALGSFWVRRARRLLPALGVMLVAVAAVTLAVGSAAQRGELRRDLPWSIFYLGNWGQIVGGIPYYAADPPLLRHLWSLAIEEQFYLVWPLVFLALARTGWSNQVMARLLGGTAVVVMVWVFWLHAGGPGPVGVFGGVDRVNVMYLSTFTRAGGLLLGCAAAFVWRPWRTPAPRADRDRQPGRVLDVVGGLAIGMLACIASVAVLTDGYVYQWLLPLISVLSLVAVLVAVHPAALGMRRVLGCRPLVAVGVRSYGLYLWHWPIFVLVGATTASVTRFAIAVVLTVVLAELSYRYVEVPVRQGALSQWWRTAGDERGRPVLVAACAVGLLASCYV